MTRETTKTPAARKKPQQSDPGGQRKAPAKAAAPRSSAAKQPAARKAAAPKPAPRKAAAAKVAPAKPTTRTTRTAAAKKAAPAKRAPAKRTRRKPVDTKPNVEEPGPVERQVRKDLEAVVSGHPMGEALAAMSYALAREIDKGPVMMRAALNRELRLNLVELAGMSVPSDDLGAELSQPEGGAAG